MVKLTDDYLNNPNKFKKNNIQTPNFNQEDMEQETDKNPVWVHFGGGNLFRCFHAEIAQNLLDHGDLKSGLIIAETYDDQVIEQVYQPFNNRILQVVMQQSSTYKKKLLASVAESIYYNHNNPKGWLRLKQIFCNPTLQMVTMSITEKGYQLLDAHGNLTDNAKQDIKEGPDKSMTNMGMIARLLFCRYNAGAFPLAMISTDNFSENGHHFEEGILTIAKGWAHNKFVPKSFIDYLQDETQISFPWSMIDRITPNPSELVAQQLKKTGFEDIEIIHTLKNTNIAPFGNTEETHYLVIEDNFPNGRPALENAGVILTNRETVNDADQMKVTACLNPLHTALAIFGCLLNQQSISEEMKNPTLVSLIKQLGYFEGLPVVKNPKIINPRAFIDELINVRLPNKNIPDTPQRIASDTSQKISIRYGVTIQHYIESKRSLQQLIAIPLVFAGWCRYLMGIDDSGNSFEISPDPLLSELQPIVSDINLNSKISVHDQLMPILSNKSIFGHDLNEIGLAEKVEEYFKEMITGPGAVIKTLQRALED